MRRNAMPQLLLLALCGCNPDTLSTQYPRISIVPLPEGGQVALEEPPGLDLGAVPLYGVVTAIFQIDNDSPADLAISSVTVDSAVGGDFVVTSFPAEIDARKSGILTATFTPAGDGVVGSANLLLATNAGEDGNEVATAYLTGVGVFIGEPNLEVCYAGSCKRLPEDCDFASGTCRLPPLDFGNVMLSSIATQQVRLTNAPSAGTCLAPPGTPTCTPTCVVTFAPAAQSLGLGISPADVGFDFEGNLPLPVLLGSHEPVCEGTSAVLRRDLDLNVAYAAADTEVLNVTGNLVLESNDPNATLVEIPLTASSRRGPTAVARIRECDVSNPPPSCSIPDAIRPLSRVYLDGSSSFDPDGRPLASYAWTVLDAPSGADPLMFIPEGADTAYFSMLLPIAGTYVMRLAVQNDLGVASGVSPTSDVEVVAIPEERMHIQLTWNHESSDLDLHVVAPNVGGTSFGDLIFNGAADCCWRNCKPACTAPDCDPVQWVSTTDPFTGPNPHLDIDDTYGLGPENTNIDAPAPGRYRIYVHYYGLISTIEDATVATIRLYLDGVQRGEFSRTLDRNDLWRVAEIEWFDDASPVVTTPSPDEEGKVGQVRQMPSFHYPEGESFGSTF